MPAPLLVPFFAAVLLAALPAVRGGAAGPASADVVLTAQGTGQRLAPIGKIAVTDKAPARGVGAARAGRSVGIGYPHVRTHIHSCDFSSESYNCVKAGDTKLATFDVAHAARSR